MVKDRQTIVKMILRAWISHHYDEIMPNLTDDIVYTVGEGAAKSISHTAGIFVGKDKVKLWYDSHTWIRVMYGKSVVNPLCDVVRPPQVVTYEDASVDFVVAVGTVGLGVPQELPCLWMSTWQFRGDLVSSMVLIADSVGGLDQFANARKKQIAKIQAAALKKKK
jgi:hypothetical protein